MTEAADTAERGMNKAEIIEKLRAFPYDPGEYWVLAGGAMVLHGIREETGDIDLGCTTGMADRLEAEGYLYRITPDGNRWFRVGDGMEVFENWIFDRTVRIGGIPVISIPGLIEMKQRLGREKDMKDIELIKKHAGNRLVLLNGPSSAGKSTIVGMLREKLRLHGADPVIISIDDYMKISTDEEIWEDDVFEIVPDMSRDIIAALRKGQWVIVDHVITSARIYEALLEAADGFPVTGILVTCSLETLRKREKERGNRFAGTAEASYRYLYPREGYDLRIDSGETGPEDAAERILALILKEDAGKSRTGEE